MKEKDSWELRCSEEKFEDLRNDERFWSIVTLARTLNALRFSQVAFFAVSDEDTPAARRQRINSFVYSSAILYEALNFAQTLGKYFSDLPEFQEGFGRLFQDKALLQFRDTTLHQIRNKFTFHFDGQVPPQALQHFTEPPYIFASGLGPTVGNTYYELADLASLYYLLTENGEELKQGELEARFIDLTTSTKNISEAFGIAGDKLIGAGLVQLDPAAQLSYLPATEEDKDLS